MIAVKRLEIVVDAPTSARVIELLERNGLEGWTLVRGASGSGERGARRGDDITGVADNHIILTTCAPDRLEQVVADLRPVLVRSGGMCLVSDAAWLRH